MADIQLAYGETIIARLSDSGNLKLKTAGRYCEKDIDLSYVRPAGSALVDEWDFTNSLVGLNRNIIATTSNVIQDSSGITFGSNVNGYLSIPVSILPITIELDVASMSVSDGDNRRFIMFSGDSGLIYRGTATYHKWGFYNGSWEMTEITDRSFFSNCTVKVSVNNSGLWSIYKDDTLVFQSTGSLVSARSFFTIGTGSYSINNTVVTGLRVY